MAAIYILHFSRPLSHAEHYAGCTEHLQRRLAAHANGAGSRLCRELLHQGIEWVLAGLYQCSHTAMRRLERHIKDSHNLPRFCKFCAGDLPSKPPDTIPYPIDMLPFPTDSLSIRNIEPADCLPAIHFVCPSGQIEVRQTSPDEPATTMKFVKDLMCTERDALGFIPAGGKEGLQLSLERGRLLVARNNGEDVGYLAFTTHVGLNTATIAQCCVRDDARLMGHGEAMIQTLKGMFPTATLKCKVRDDLAANHFWQAVGFQHQRQVTHRTSHSILNQYLFTPKG